MADPTIVSCPGCGKRYSVPPGVPPGQFQCQDCSATVAYGGGAGDDGGDGGGPSIAPSGRKAGRAARARKKVRDRVAAREAEEEPGGRRRGAPAKKAPNAAPFVIAILGVGGLAIGGIVMMKGDKSGAGSAEAGGTPGKRNGGRLSSEDLSREPETAEAGNAGSAATTPEAGTGDGEPEADAGESSGGLRSRPKPGTEKEEPDTDARKYETVEQPPAGGNYGKSTGELRDMLARDRPSVMTELPHLPDTPTELAAEIDRLIKVMKDPDAGREVFEAREKLIEIGRPAVPKLLGALADLKFPENEPITDHVAACLVADQVDIAMREITGWEKIYPLQFTPQGQLRRYQRVTENWMVLWLSTLYDRKYFPKDLRKQKEEPGGEEEL